MKLNSTQVSRAIRLSSFLVLVIMGEVFATTFTVTKIADTQDGLCDSDCSLREAIVAANSDEIMDTIIVPAGIYTNTIGSYGLLLLTESMNISGAGAGATVFDGARISTSVVIVRSGVTVELSGVTIQGGGGGNNNERGGGILNEGELTLTNCSVISNSSKGPGGGIFNDNLLTIQNCTISSNSTIRGLFGLRDGGGIYNGGTLTLLDSVVSGNTSVGNGGGISSGTVTVIDSTIKGNNAGYSGGGIYSFGSSTFLTVIKSTIDLNTARDGGGIIFRNDATLINSTVSGNVSVQDKFGAAGISGSGTLSLTNSTITGNIPFLGVGGITNRGSTSVTTLSNTLINGACDFTFATVTSNGGNLESPGDTCGLNDSSDQFLISSVLLSPLTDNGGGDINSRITNRQPCY